MNENDKLLALISRNDIDQDKIQETVYRTLLLSVFETTLSNINNLGKESEAKERIRTSQNKNVTIMNIIYENSGCKISDEEAKVMHKLFCANFAKGDKRKSINDPALRNKILAAQNYHCALCGVKIDNSHAELDHIIPWDLVGDELGEKNLQMLCVDCNRHKSDKITYEIKSLLIDKSK